MCLQENCWWPLTTHNMRFFDLYHDEELLFKAKYPGFESDGRKFWVEYLW